MSLLFFNLNNRFQPDRQVTMWSATWPKEVRELASTYLRSDEDPVRICVGSSELTANSDVHQKFIFSSSDKKKETLVAHEAIRKLDI